MEKTNEEKIDQLKKEIRTNEFFIGLFLVVATVCIIIIEKNKNK